MTQEQIYTKLTNVFHNVFDDDSIALNPAMTANDVPDWDSLNHVNLIVATEAAFHIKFRTAELESLRDVGQLVEVIAAKTSS